jgi:restriction system protein
MPIPDFQTLMLPVLKYTDTHGEHTLREATEFLAKEFELTPAEVPELLPSGRQPMFYNRVGWARTYLKQAQSLELRSHNHLAITERGKQVLADNPTRIDMKYLERFPEYVAFRERTKPARPEVPEMAEEEHLSPDEQLETAYQRTRGELAGELLDRVRSSSSVFFEQLVVELLTKMGYGGSRGDAARAVGRSGDEGIDGIIDEDKLGLDSIYIQAKRWSENPIGRPEIQQFVGALQGKRARKGVFITTSRFSDQAKVFAASVEARVVLIDGERLAQLMIDHDVGVSTVAEYALKKLDADYFYETSE